MPFLKNNSIFRSIIFVVEEKKAPQKISVTSKLNWLRAAVLGANDGIVSMAGLVLGVAAATNSISIILTAGVAGIISGAISMAAGEYVSVSSSRDTERVLIKKEKYELKHSPEEELAELAGLYEARGLSPKTASLVAQELTAKDPIRAHLDAEFGINEDDLTNPWHAAIASATSFFLGALVPLIAITLPPAEMRIPVAFVAIVVALVATGLISGKISGANLSHAIMRIVAGGILAMVVTYIVGRVFHVTGI